MNRDGQSIITAYGKLDQRAETDDECGPEARSMPSGPRRNQLALGTSVLTSRTTFQLPSGCFLKTVML